MAAEQRQESRGGYREEHPDKKQQGAPLAEQQRRTQPSGGRRSRQASGKKGIRPRRGSAEPGERLRDPSSQEDFEKLKEQQGRLGETNEEALERGSFDRQTGEQEVEQPGPRGQQAPPAGGAQPAAEPQGGENVVEETDEEEENAA